MKYPMIATITVHKGLTAVTNTGPLDFTTTPCTKYNTPEQTIPCMPKWYIEIIIRDGYITCFKGQIQKSDKWKMTFNLLLEMWQHSLFSAI
jgi:hypothetical protein